MNLTISRESLNFALNRVKGAVSSRPVNPALSCVLMRARGQSLELVTTNLDMQISHAVEAQIATEGSVLLPFSSFLQFATNFGQQDIAISVDDKLKCSLICGGSRGSISGMSPKEFTEFPAQEHCDFAMAQADLKAALKKTLISVSKDSTRFALCGVFVELQKNRLSFVSTDGRQLSQVKSLLDGDGIQAIISTGGASAVFRLLSDTGEVSVKIGKHFAEFSVGGTTLVSKLIDAVYTNYRQVIPESFTHRMTIDRDEFLSAVKYVGWIADSNKAPVMVWEFSRNKLSLHQVSSSDEARRDIAVKYSGPDMEIGMAPERVSVVLSALTETEVALEIIDNLSPVSIKAGNFNAIIMPCRLG